MILCYPRGPTPPARLDSLSAHATGAAGVVATASGETGYEQAVAQPFDCVVLDLMLPGRDGLQVLASLRQAGHSTPDTRQELALSE